MNLNYNINNTLLSRNRNFFLGKVGFEWSRTVSVAAGIQSGSIIFATGSIEYVPYAPTTLFVSGTYQAEQLGSGSALGLPVNIAITGSGVWAVTGSNDFSIVIGGNLGFNQSETLSLSAAAGNMNLSGSKISSSFNPEGNQEYSISFGVEHTKGNIYNPLVKFKTQNTSPVSTTELINGNTTASFNIVKDETVPLVYVKEVSSSFSSQFNYEYNFGVTSSLTASIGNNITGSTTMSIEIPQAGVTKTEKYFNPASEGTQIITASFAATTDSTYDITASVTYNKGNISTASINFQTFQSSTTEDLEGDTTNINGVSSSFQIRKDATVTTVLIPEVSGSVKSGSYSNEYAFNQTASLTQNSNNTTGSVTMSIVVPEADINIEQRFFNPTTTQALLTASFAAQTIVGYNITASLINNKGNISNSNINWSVTSSKLNNSASIASSFGIRKDGNVQILNVNDALIATGSSFKNTYAFNITSSLTSSYTSYYTPDSSSFYFGKSTLIIPEVGINLFSYGTSSLITGSFEAQTSIDDYNISANMEEENTQLIEYALIGGGGGGGAAAGQNPGAGGGAGALLTGSIKILPNETYNITIGKGGLSYTNGETSIFGGKLVPYDGTWTNNIEITSSYLIAPGGGRGGYGINGANPPSAGGSGGGGAGFGVDQLSQPPSAGTRPGALAVSASVLNNTMTASFIDINAAGAAGGAGVLLGRQAVPGFFYGAGGNGGGKPTNISWLDGIINSGNVAGGGGGGNQWAQGSYQTTPGFGGGNGQSITGVEGNAVQFTGGGGGGASTYSSGPTSTAGYGASGSMSIRYPGLQNGIGGNIIYFNGYTIHTFTSSGEFTIFSDTNPIIPTTASFDIQYAVVGGGGAGASSFAGGGGGAGQLLSGSIDNVNLTGSFNGVFNITVGEGGIGPFVVEENTGGNSGSVSILSSSFNNLVAFGGAGGVGITSNFTSSVSASAGGGSGNPSHLIGGTGFTNGGTGFYGTGSVGTPRGFAAAGAGGGGYLQSGLNASASFVSPAGYWNADAGNGGNGIQLFITSSAPYVAAGGGGGVRNNVQTNNANGIGGSGVGGDGAKFVGFQPRLSATSGRVNTGAGGGGAALNDGEGAGFGVANGGDGGSGVVYLRFPNTINLPLFSGNAPVISFDGDSTVYTFITGSTQIQFI
jgi:hypothetical protein